MPAVFVHGVPDTHRLWGRVRAELGRDDVVSPDLPGFGAPVPDGFRATKDAYLDWLIEQVAALAEPVDLVGHDWGSILVQQLVSVRPELVRTWAAGGGAVDPEYEWHELARIWQTPEMGEQLMAGFSGAGLRAMAESYAIPVDYSEVAAGLVDERMKDCILRLYRSAAQVSAEWGPDLERATSRALLIWGADDPFVDARFATRAAARVGGDALVFEGCGHWWPLERPKEVAVALGQLWDDAESRR